MNYPEGFIWWLLEEIDYRVVSRSHFFDHIFLVHADHDIQNATLEELLWYWLFLNEFHLIIHNHYT